MAMTKQMGDESQDSGSMPKHIAVVMDGNGRWAVERGLDRLQGHYEGAKAARRFVAAASERGIKVVSLYAFSSENWSRPREEVNGLMSLMREVITRELRELAANDVQVRVSGRIHELPSGLREALEEAIEETKDSRGMVLNLCINYGGRAEIVDAARALAQAVQAGELRPEEIDEAAVQARLYNGDLPDPDLVIRPGGELRISNFLLWEIAYAEFYTTPVYWPDFTERHLDEAIAEFKRRQRRFGGLGEQES